MAKWTRWGGGLALLAAAAAVSAASWYWVSARAAHTAKRAEPRVAAVAPRLSTPAAFRIAPQDDSGFDYGAFPPARVAPKSGGTGTYVVMFQDAPLATYRGGVAGLVAPKRKAGAFGRARLDVRSPESQRYVGYLAQRQRLMERQFAAAFGRAPTVRRRMHHAVNAIVVDLTSDEAARAARMPGVRLVEGYRLDPLHTDTGPTLIGAPQVWNGIYPEATGAFRGEGMVIGIIDSGINFGSPSFAAADPIDGYVHSNPFGAGVYRGTCAPGGVDQGRCNPKLIAGYDFVCGAPGNQCGATNVREEPGFGDTNSHGSHVASTAAGNMRDAVFAGSPRRISGVAPRANVIAYDVCYTDTSTGRGLCPNASSVAAINQAVADGVVDVINFSISGGQDPWNESVSQAFLSAVEAGIYVAASAGNSGPAPATLSHLQPWVASTAAVQHGRGAFAVSMTVTGPAPVPPSLAPLRMVEGTGGTPLTATIPGNTPIRPSPGIDTADDGCNGFAAGSFAGAIAVVRRGSCTFVIKVNNAVAAGAIAVVIANNTAGGFTPSVPATTIPVFALPQFEADGLRNFLLAFPNATAQIAYPAEGTSNVPDALAAFSSRGPANAFELLKPDVAAPGVDVLAVTAGTSITGFEQSVGLLSGTSMASPHHAGAVALIRQARPTWTAAEVRSALTMTATQTVLREDQVTLASPYDRGSGRIRVERAINAGLVMDVTAQQYSSANPAFGGDPSQLNLPSLVDLNCTTTCNFTRTFRNTKTYGALWAVTLTGQTTGTVQSLMWVPFGATRTLNIAIDGTQLPTPSSPVIGNLELVELYSGIEVNEIARLRLPIVVARPLN